MADFWERYSRSRSAVLGLGILGLVIFMAAIAHMIFPEDLFKLTKYPLSDTKKTLLPFIIGVFFDPISSFQLR